MIYILKNGSSIDFNKCIQEASGIQEADLQMAKKVVQELLAERLSRVVCLVETKDKLQAMTEGRNRAQNYQAELEDKLHRKDKQIKDLKTKVIDLEVTLKDEKRIKTYT